MTKANIHCLPTGVPGLDEVPGRGLPEFSFDLIAGSPSLKIDERLDDRDGLPGGRPTRRGEPGDTANGTHDE
jgi:hypothetical protein